MENYRNTCDDIKERTPDIMEVLDMLESLEKNKPKNPTKFYIKEKEYYINLLRDYDRF